MRLEGETETRKQQVKVRWSMANERAEYYIWIKIQKGLFLFYYVSLSNSSYLYSF